MDAAYLKDNVYPALTEALTAMAVAIPEDKVEYMGKYLLRYVERKKKRQEFENDLAEIASRESLDAQATEETKANEESVKLAAENERAKKISEEKEAFAALNKKISEDLLGVMSKIVDLEIAALTYVPPAPEPAEGENGENPEGGEGAPPAEPTLEPPAPVITPAATEGAEGAEGGEAPVDAGPPPITEKEFKDSMTVMTVWNNLFLPSEPVYISYQTLSKWTPAPLNGDSSVCFTTAMDERIVLLLSTLALFLGVDVNAGKDPISGTVSWSQMRMKLLPQILAKLVAYQTNAKVTVPPEASLATITETCTAQQLLDPASYPEHVPIASVLAQWFEKALNARSLAIRYYTQTGQEALETVEVAVVEATEEEE